MMHDPNLARAPAHDIAAQLVRISDEACHAGGQLDYAATLSRAMARGLDSLALLIKETPQGILRDYIEKEISDLSCLLDLQAAQLRYAEGHLELLQTATEAKSVS